MAYQHASQCLGTITTLTVKIHRRRRATKFKRLILNLDSFIWSPEFGPNEPAELSVANRRMAAVCCSLIAADSVEVSA